MALTICYGSAVSNQKEKLQEMIIDEAIQHPKNRYIVLVPEQASLTVQEEYVKKHPRHALFNIDILTFNRLCYRVFKDVREKEKNFISENGKLMMIRLLVSEMEKDLGSLKRSIHHEGFLRELKSVFSELAQYNITPEKVKEGAEKIEQNKVLSEKMKDIALLYEGFLNRVHKKYELSEERIGHLGSVLKDWRAASETVLVLDGFTGFTPPQYEAIEAFFRYCKDIYLGVVLGSHTTFENEKEEDDLFYMSSGMVTRFKELAVRNSTVCREIPAEEGKHSCEICHIEKNLFRKTKEKYEHGTEHFRIIKAADEETEVRYVLHEILRSVREDGIAFRDMAVVCGNPEEYETEIRYAFSEAGVPFFLDISRKITNNPLTLFIEEIRDLLLRNFDFDSVFHLAKNPLFLAFAKEQVEEEKDFDIFERISETENYVKAIGIRGANAYKAEWKYEYRNFDPERLGKINEVREKVFGVFIAFSQEFQGEILAKVRIEKLRKLFADVNASDTLQKMILDEETELEKKKEYEAIFSSVNELFEEIVHIFGEQSTSAETFFELLLAGIAEQKIGIAPPTKDRVVIGDVKRTRLTNIKRLYVIGANEGRFPAAGSNGGLLTDSDREELSKNQIVLSETSRQELFQMQFYLYLLLTKPAEALMITYANSDKDGKLMTPSNVLAQLKALFPDLQVESIGFARDIQNTPDDYLKDFAKSLQTAKEKSEKLQKIYSWGFSDELSNTEIRNRLLNIKENYSYLYQAVSLNRETAKALYGDNISGSVTRLEQYAKCPYAHFLQYGLKLQEAVVHEIKAADMGTLFHDCIDCFFRMLKKENLSLRDLENGKKLELVQKAVEEVASKDKNFILKETERNKYLIERTKRVINRTVSALEEQLKAGKYDQIETEVTFGKDGGDFLQLTLEDSTLLSLEGRIDRIDAFDDGNKIFVRVIDYKSGENSLDATRIYNGLQLQLLIYLQAAMRRAEKKSAKKEIIPAGIYYYHIQDPVIENDEKKILNIEKEIQNKLRLNGLTEKSKGSLMTQEVEFAGEGAYTSATVVNVRTAKSGELYKNSAVLEGSQLKKLSHFALSKAAEIGNCIKKGEKEISPFVYKQKNGCEYCPYKGVCGFDSHIPGYSKRVLKDEKKLEDCIENDGDKLE